MNISMHAGPCADYEHEIVELAEGSLAPEKARVVRTHVASCARCRAWQSAFADTTEPGRNGWSSSIER